MSKKGAPSKLVSSLRSKGIPGLAIPIVYANWLNQAWRYQPSLFASATKNDIDGHFEMLLPQRGKLSDDQVAQHLREVHPSRIPAFIRLDALTQL